MSDLTERREATERWFRYQGMPHLIIDYRATTDVFTRMMPLLVVVFFVEVFASFGDRFSGWAQAGVFALGLVIMVGAAAVVNRLRGRRPFQLPDDIGYPEIGVFCLVPALLPLLFGDDPATYALAIVIVNVTIVVVGYVVVGYGVIYMVWWGAGQLAQQLTGLTRLVGRTMPLLLLFATFIFLNAEMWQVAHDFTPAFYAVVLFLVFLPAVTFLIVRTPTELDGLAVFTTWREIDALAEASDAPCAGGGTDGRSDPPTIAPLTKGSRRNMGLLLLVGQVVQMILVAVVVGIFYFVFGLFTVREETLLQWTTTETAAFDPIARIGLFGADVVLTWELLAVAGFIAGFSALQFAVSLLTDTEYRQEFFGDMTDEIRTVLAVRARYLDSLVG